MVKAWRRNSECRMKTENHEELEQLLTQIPKEWIETLTQILKEVIEKTLTQIPQKEMQMVHSIFLGLPGQRMCGLCGYIWIVMLAYMVLEYIIMDTLKHMGSLYDRI